MKIGIVIPAFLSSELLLDFTKQTIESIKSINNEIAVYLVVTGGRAEYYPTKEMFALHESIVRFEIRDNPNGNEVGAAWNYGIQTALDDGCEFVIVANNDIVFHNRCVDNLVAFADSHPQFILWTASEWIDIRTLNGVKEADITYTHDEHPHFSCFMVNKKTIDTVGLFDENLTMAYHEDGDFHTRILLSGNKAAKTASAKFYHYGSRTIKVDDEIYEKNKRSYEDNRKYVEAKWGVDFHGMVFDPPESILEKAYKHPFNNPAKTIKDW